MKLHTKYISLLLLLFCILTCMISCSETDAKHDCSIGCIFSCKIKTPDDAKNELKKANYPVTIYGRKFENFFKVYNINYKHIDALVHVEGKNDYAAFLYVIYCDDKKAAETVEADCQYAIYNSIPELLETTSSTLSADDFCVKRKQNVVIFGLEEIADVIF